MTDPADLIREAEEAEAMASLSHGREKARLLAHAAALWDQVARMKASPGAEAESPRSMRPGSRTGAGRSASS